MTQIKVAVSPFYGGEDWTCDKTGITFKRSVNGLNVYTISEGVDLTNIRKAVRLNALILMDGEIPKEEVEAQPVQEQPKAEEPKQEEPKQEQPKAEEPKEEEPVLEMKEEEEAEKPKSKSRRTSKSTASKK